MSSTGNHPNYPKAGDVMVLKDELIYIHTMTKLWLIHHIINLIHLLFSLRISFWLFSFSFLI